jgi:UDP-glucuronate 4-epimerase
MNILITGAAGFIGSSLADRLLAEGHRVINVDNFNDYYDVKIKWRNISANINNDNYKLYCLNIENKSDLFKVFQNEKIDVVIHLAGRAGVRPSIQDPESYVKTNILGTVHILELMKDFGVKKLVFASSSSVYGNCYAEMFSEDLKVVEPISQYAATKSSDEQFVYTYSKLYGIQAVCLRFFTVYGPRQRPDLAISKFTRLILNDEPVPMYGDGTTKRDYTYIDDIVAGIMGAVEYDKTPYEIVNLGGGEPITLLRMIETIEAELGKKAVVTRLPMQAGDVTKTVCDYSKARSLFGYCPHTTFKEGIHLFCDWYRKQ